MLWQADGDLLAAWDGVDGNACFPIQPPEVHPWRLLKDWLCQG